MSLFRVGDIVTFTNLLYGLQNINGKIVKVLKDTAKGSEFDSYNIETQWRGGLRKFVIRNRHIHNLVAGADNNGEAIPAPEMPNLPGVDGPIFVLPNPLFDNPAVPAQEVLANIKGRQEEIIAAKKEEEVKRLQKIAKDNGEKKLGIFEQLYRQNWGAVGEGDANEAEKPVPKPMPIRAKVEKPAANLKEYEQFGLLPEYILFTKNNFPIPVFDRQKAKGTRMGITGSDYNAENLNAKRYYIFTTKNGNILEPQYDPYDQMIFFKCKITGHIFYNQHQKAGLHIIDERTIDTDGQTWVSKPWYLMYMKKGKVANGPLKPRRKLRQKYQEMPQIKEEKHYDSKDYIA